MRCAAFLLLISIASPALAEQPVIHRLDNPTAVTHQLWKPVFEVQLPGSAATCCPKKMPTTCTYYIIPPSGKHGGAVPYKVQKVSESWPESWFILTEDIGYTFLKPGTYELKSFLSCSQDWARMVTDQIQVVEASSSSGLTPDAHARAERECEPFRNHMENEACTTAHGGVGTPQMCRVATCLYNTCMANGGLRPHPDFEKCDN